MFVVDTSKPINYYRGSRKAGPPHQNVNVTVVLGWLQKLQVLGILRDSHLDQ